jgi:hypothetical protein
MRKNNWITSPSEHYEVSLLLTPGAAGLIHLSAPRVSRVAAINVFNFPFMVLLKHK